MLLTFLREDVAGGDISSACFFDLSGKNSQNSVGKFIAKSEGIVAGLDIIAQAYHVFMNNINQFSIFNTTDSGGEGDSNYDSNKANSITTEQAVTLHFKDGDRCKPGDVLAEVRGNTYVLLCCERVILNLLQRMSGIATYTHDAVTELGDPSITVLDTRKNAPGLRIFDKMAVVAGGGKNHRFGLYDAIMIKDNHISAAGSISNAVKAVRDKFDDKYSIEVEVKNKLELLEAVSLSPDIIMLDNMSPEQIKELTKLVPDHIKSEVSGGVTLENIAHYRGCGANFISIGALTHSVKALDISFLLV